MIKNLEKEVRSRIETNERRNQIIGSEIKKRRLERELTQDRVTKGKISVSYLSKIENGKIQPNEYYLKEILNNMEIDKGIINYYETYLELIAKISQSYYEEDTEMINHYYEKAINFDFDMMIVKFIYLIYHKKYNKALEFYEKLYAIRVNLSNFELITSIIFMCEYEYRNENYLASNNLKLIINNIGITNKYVKAIYNRIIFDHAIIFNDLVNLKYFKDKVIKNLIEFNVIKKIHNLETKYYFQILHNNFNSTQAREYLENNLIKKSIAFFKYKFYIQDYLYILKYHKECNNCIEKIILLVKCYYILNKKHELEKVFIEKKDFLFMNAKYSDLLFLKYIEIYLTGNTFAMNKYLIKEAIPNALKNGLFQDVITFEEILSNNYFNDSRYKNGFLTIIKIKETIKKMTKKYEYLSI